MSCPLCNNLGFLACPEAYALDGRGVFLVVAWELGLACGCAAGERFRRDQAEWKKEAEPAQLQITEML